MEEINKKTEKIALKLAKQALLYDKNTDTNEVLDQTESEDSSDDYSDRKGKDHDEIVIMNP